MCYKMTPITQTRFLTPRLSNIKKASFKEKERFSYRGNMISRTLLLVLYFVITSQELLRISLPTRSTDTSIDPIALAMKKYVTSQVIVILRVYYRSSDLPQSLLCLFGGFRLTFYFYLWERKCHPKPRRGVWWNA